jgi:hypothetical protein
MARKGLAAQKPCGHYAERLDVRCKWESELERPFTSFRITVSSI